jgi:Zn-dependent protease
MELNIIQKLAIYALPVIFAITLHEAAHGYVAKYFGDMTAFAAGRVSLNPLRHIDPVGTVLLPLGLLVLSKLFGGGIIFGWAKPVPVNFGNLRHPKRDMLWVAAAGPGSNLVMALFWAVMIKIALANPGTSYATPLALMGAAGLIVNAIFMVLNLLPLPPLDGGRIMVSLLPHRLAYPFSRIEPYGFIILLVLLFAGVLNYVMWPLVSLSVSLISGVLDIPSTDISQLLSILSR